MTDTRVSTSLATLGGTGWLVNSRYTGGLIEYWIDGTGSGGDSLAGNSKGTAWASTANLATAPRPDRLYIRGDSVFRSIFSIPWSGAGDSPILITRYGNGKNPRWLGSSNQPGGTWTAVAGTEYKIATSITAPTGNVPIWWVANDGTITRLNKGTAGSLTSGQFAFGGGFVNVNLGYDPKDSGSLEIPLRDQCILVDGKSFIRFEEIDALHAFNDGFSIRNAADTIEIAGCNPQWVANDCINGYNKVTNILIEYCTITGSGELVTYLGDGASFHEDSSGVIRYNTFDYCAKDSITNSERGTWDCYGNMSKRTMGGDAFSTYNDVGTGAGGVQRWWHNIAYDSGVDRVGVALYKYAADLGCGGTVSFDNNIAYRGAGTHATARGARFAGTSGTINFRNNVIDGAFQIGLVASGVVGAAATLANNCVPSAANGGPTTGYSGIAAGAGSITTDATYADETNHNFTPAAGAVQVDAGMVIAGITDGYRGTAPDIGPIER